MRSFSDELYHYGVKGMKWGVRRTPEQLGYGPYSQQKEDVILPKGTKFQRIVTMSNSGINKGVYVSYKKKDRDLYRGVLGRMRLSSQSGTGNDVTLKEITMTTKQEIRLPSRSVRLNEFKKLYDSDPEGVLAFINEHESSRYGKKSRESINLNSKRELEAEYRKFNDALAMGQASKNKNIITRYFYELQKKGYNAIPDENDIRLSTFKAQAPIILFNTNKSIGDFSVRDLSASEVYSAYRRSIGQKTARQILEKRGIGFEKLRPDTMKQSEKYYDQIQKDKLVLDPSYTLTDLANDWRKNRLSASQIAKVSKAMSSGKTHDEAVAEVLGLGNVAVDWILGRLRL